MQKRYPAACLLAGLWILLLTSCGGKQAERNETAGTPEAAPAQDTVLTPNFYKRMEGTIAGQPVMMHLQAAGGVVTGLYYYLEQGLWITVSGVLDPARPSGLSLTESNFSNGEKTAVMEMQYSQGTLKGSWTSADGKRNYLVDLKETYPEGAYAFTTRRFADSLKADPAAAGSPQAHIERSFVIPLDNGKTGQWIEAQLKTLMNLDSTLQSRDLAAAVQAGNSRYLENYREEIRGMKKESDGSYASFLNYEDMAHVSVCYNGNGYLILEASVYAYTGGAHGNGGSSFTCLDVQHRKELKLNDVLSADSAQLQPLVEAAFRKQQGLKPADSLNTILFENHLATTQNFYFTNKGIGFYYFPYEVAAYAVGPIHVFVPFASLKAYLRPAFAQRMGL